MKKYILLLITAISFAQTPFSGGVKTNYIIPFSGTKIGINTTTPQAALDVTSTTSGILIPRMTTTQRNAVSTPATSLLIWNTTTAQFEYYNGTIWTVLDTTVTPNTYVPLSGTTTGHHITGQLDFDSAGIFIDNGSIGLGNAGGDSMDIYPNFISATNAGTSDNFNISTDGGFFHNTTDWIASFNIVASSWYNVATGFDQKLIPNPTPAASTQFQFPTGLAEDTYTLLTTGNPPMVNASGDGIDITDGVIDCTNVVADSFFTSGEIRGDALRADGQTTNTIALFDGSRYVVSADTATYPNLTELANVKGLNNPIQPQIAGKQPLDSDLTAIAAIATDSFGRGLLIQTSAANVRSYIGAGTGSGTVTAIGVTTANGVSGSSSGGATPNLTLVLGAITPTSVAASGALSGSNLSGTNTGDQTSVTGNAGTATALQTPRNINGVSFNGTADIIVTAAAGTLTGTTLNSTVVNSSLTSTGTVATGTWQATAIAPTYGGTGQNSSAATGVAQVSSGTWSFSTALANGTTATTQAVTDNTTKTATDAFVNNMLDYVTPEMFSAVGDGTTNDATALANMITYAKANKKVVHLTNGQIYLTDTALVTGSGLVIYGNGATLKTNSNISIISITGDYNIIQNVRFLGNSTGATQRAISCIGVVGLTTYRLSNWINGCFFNGFASEGIYGQYMIGTSTGSKHEGSMYIFNNTFTVCGRGIFLDTRSEYCTMGGNVFYTNTTCVQFVGGNNNIYGGSMTDSTTGIAILSGTNDGHSAATNIKINHNTTNISCTHANNWVFDNDIIYAGACSFTGTGVTIVSNCQINMSTFTLTITNSPVQFFNNQWNAKPTTYNLTGTRPVFKENYSGTTLLGTPISDEGIYVTKTATYSILFVDDFIDCTANSFTVTLPTAVGYTDKNYTVHNSGTGLITIASTSSQTFENFTTLSPGETVTFKSDGANYKVVSSQKVNNIVDVTSTAYTTTTLNSTYPNVRVGFDVIAPNVATGMIYRKITEAGSSDVWHSWATAVVTP